MADLQDGLKLSDFGSRVRYVPLETSDSCLIGRTQWALWSERGLLVPSSSRNEVRMYSFDMETGRFITNVGHRGEDPKGYKGTLILEGVPISCRSMIIRETTMGK